MIIKNATTILLFFATIACSPGTTVHAQIPSNNTIFDDQMLLEGYTKKYSDFSKETLLAMIKDDTLTPYRSAGAVRVFQEKHSGEVVSNEKKGIEKILLRRLHRTDSPFVQVADTPPSTKQTVGSNRCLIYPTYNEDVGRFIIVSCLDNLGKGGASGGVQCLNLMLGLPESAGLEGLALYP